MDALHPGASQVTSTVASPGMLLTSSRIEASVHDRPQGSVCVVLRERGIYLGDDYERAPSGLLLPPSAAPAPPVRKPIGLDLFAGCGGFSCGFKMAGIHVAAALEGWATAAWTYLVNLGGTETLVRCIGDVLPEGSKREIAWHAEHRDELVPADEFIAMMSRGRNPLKTGGFDADGDATCAGGGWIAHQDDTPPCEVFYLGDVRALTGELVLADLDRDELDVVFGGPPCQGFSRAGQRAPDDPRNELVFEFMRVVCEIHPRTFAMENVPGMLDMVTKEGLPVIDALAMMAEEGGMGTFQAIRQTLAETAGVGAALRTQKAKASKPRPGSQAPRDRLDIDEDEPAQLDLLAEAAA
jgi:DNA (cytosine-5)-methyltransferase 1